MKTPKLKDDFAEKLQLQDTWDKDGTALCAISMVEKDGAVIAYTHDLQKNVRSHLNELLIRYNGYPQLQEQNKVMIEALRRISGITERFSIDTMTTINSIAKAAIQSAS